MALVMFLTWRKPHGGWSHQVTSVNEGGRAERHARPHGREQRHACDRPGDGDW